MKKNFSKNLPWHSIKGVMLDLDNTLYDYGQCNNWALRRCWQFVKKSRCITYRGFLRRYASARGVVKKWLPTQAAGHSRFLYFQKLLEELEGSTNVIGTIVLAQLYWKSFFSRMRLYPEAKIFLRQCQTMGIHVCLLTDLTAQIQFEKIKYLKIDKFVDYIVSSEEAGADKPCRAMFVIALDKMRLKSWEVIMVGDEDGRDRVGAEALGIKTFLIS